jgi:hypothetical protein
VLADVLAANQEMFRVIRHEAKKSFSNAAQALECIFSWRGVLSRLAVYIFWNFVSAFLLTHNERPNSIPDGRNCNKNRNKVELDGAILGQPVTSLAS